MKTKNSALIQQSTRLLLLIALWAPFTTQAGLLDQDCIPGGGNNCVQTTWSVDTLDTVFKDDPLGGTESLSKNETEELVPLALRRRLEAQAQKEEKEFQQFLASITGNPLKRGLEETSATTKRDNSLSSALHPPAIKTFADTQIAEIQAAIDKPTQKKTTHTGRDDWLAPVAAPQKSATKEPISYEKPFLMKVLERIYAFDMIDIIAMLLVLGFARLIALPFTRT